MRCALIVAILLVLAAPAFAQTNTPVHTATPTVTPTVTQTFVPPPAVRCSTTRANFEPAAVHEVSVALDGVGVQYAVSGTSPAYVHSIEVVASAATNVTVYDAASMEAIATFILSGAGQEHREYTIPLCSTGGVAVQQTDSVTTVVSMQVH